MELLKSTLFKIHRVKSDSGIRAKEHLDNLTKPPGSLGVLEEIIIQLASVQENHKPKLGKKTVMIMAADHGVVEEGVSAFPQEVTAQMLQNFANEGAAINVFSKHAGFDIAIADIGVATDTSMIPKIKQHKIASGTKNMTREPAMSKEEAIEAIEIGIKLVNDEIDNGSTLIATGEMGIGNTTASSAILACVSENDLDEITGRGTGVNNESFTLKKNSIKKAIELNKPNKLDPLDIVSKVGGLEIAALTGVILGAIARKTPVIIDGFISSAAALLAVQFNAYCRDYLFASHLSQEPGHRVMLDFMELKPMLYLDLRLGEGTGAVLATNQLEAAIKIVHEMATFDEAGISS
ncbi:Nicotinate-nucleotide--dimethylbenzimidazole phosphoribosyltransferase [Candidatus Syntrophocurvum alkaliphilum]|uniref:Nicotinate-nucleotide--dimethylbenzimidazole phosphoribosyltransferase n=1 Tax=Candidatus Syntrophocurvum alkaliphilum TaxID=2293317 RepID=A0A6I6DCC9_9FIRM|nr:nicotinate-nucleotide--dimethylbenzimidazole phosphoribosyltransferase [Candidatus Syntrophocurvum alkaliphilum]QGU00256.1 Nicotinate-nucleotide--dimethylbenzimidazole phosphoribosyltransferase [Candidatus Syntrophocurvum alkaliphilum]